MSNWIAGALFILGSLWAIPAWYAGQAAGMARVRRIILASEWTKDCMYCEEGKCDAY